MIHNLNNFVNEFLKGSAKNSVRPSKGKAEGGCGGNSALPLQKIEASPAALLVQSRTPQKSFLFLLEVKIGGAQNQKSRENFFAGWRALVSGGGAASAFGVGFPLKKGSRKVYNYSTLDFVSAKRVTKSYVPQNAGQDFIPTSPTGLVFARSRKSF